MENLLQHIIYQRPVLDDQNKFMFFGNRKVCLQSVCRHLLKDRAILKKDSPNIWNKKIKLYSLDNLHKIFKFTIVRNPWDRTISAFHAIQQSGYRLRKLKRKRLISKDQNFQDFIKGIFKEQRNDFDNHFAYQYPNAYFNEKIFVDFIARFEIIKKEWGIISDQIDCESILPHENKSKHRPYRQYYDSECREIVGNIYQKDIELFEYIF